MYFNKLDISLWKYVQDKFAKELNLPVYTIDREGNEIVVSGENAFLIDLIKSKRYDLFKERNYRQLNELEEGEIALYNFYGAMNIIKPVFLHDKKIGAVICGPIKREEFDYSDISSRLGVEEQELTDAADEIKELNGEKVDWCRRMISILAEILPKLAHQKQSRDNQISELTALQSIIKMVNSSLELDEVLKSIMEFLVNSLKATDCSVFVETEDGEKKYCLKNEVEKLTEVEKAVSKRAIEEKQIITVKDIRARFRIEVESDYNSMLSIPLKRREEIIGSINLYGKDLGKISDESLNFISVMADQVAIAVANAQRYGEVKELAVIDKLTGAYNRRYFTEAVEKALEKGINNENPLALILLDIDDFGKYNNAHGHPMGDKLLKELSNVLKKNVKEGDIVGRYGGEEFIIMMPGLKSSEAMTTAKRLKEAIEETNFEGGETQPKGRVTISLGLVSCMDKVTSSDMIKEADSALYKAKDTGKNRVVQRIILKDNLRTEMSSEV
ncbi:diguanylate cyclase [Candidatus Woesearchaeota archaeon]|nr:diguanylate cyclase [Candidatus Woesearchaeota archaeon]